MPGFYRVMIFRPPFSLLRVDFDVCGPVYIKSPSFTLLGIEFWVLEWDHEVGSVGELSADTIKATLKRAAQRLVQTEMLPLAYLAGWRE